MEATELENQHEDHVLFYFVLVLMVFVLRTLLIFLLLIFPLIFSNLNVHPKKLRYSFLVDRPIQFPTLLIACHLDQSNLTIVNHQLLVTLISSMQDYFLLNLLFPFATFQIKMVFHLSNPWHPYLLIIYQFLHHFYHSDYLHHQ